MRQDISFMPVSILAEDFGKSKPKSITRTDLWKALRAFFIDEPFKDGELHARKWLLEPLCDLLALSEGVERVMDAYEDEDDALETIANVTKKCGELQIDGSYLGSILGCYITQVGVEHENPHPPG